MVGILLSLPRGRRRQLELREAERLSDGVGWQFFGRLTEINVSSKNSLVRNGGFLPNMLRSVVQNDSLLSRHVDSSPLLAKLLVATGAV